MSDTRFRLVTGNAGSEVYEFDGAADVGDVDRAYQEAWQSITDEVGATSVQKLARLRAFSQAKAQSNLKAEVLRYLKAMQARMDARLAEIAGQLKNPQVNTLTSYCWRQIGYGASVTLSLEVPRSMPALICGFSGISRTIRSIGLQQMQYASLPVVDVNKQDPPYASFGGIAVNWIPLTFLQNEFDRECGNGCSPRFMASRLWFPSSPITSTFVQTASVGDDSVPFQDHSVGILCVTAFRCHIDLTWETETAKYAKAAGELRSHLGFSL